MATVPHMGRFAARTARMGASAIRELLKVTQQPDVISFAGGLPAPELFPTQAIAQGTAEVMRDIGPAALQYSLTDGIPELRDWVADRLTHRTGAAFERDDVMMVNGSQQGLDLIAKIFIDPGDHIVLENPSYLGAIQAFDAYQARYLTVETDDDGMVPESLDDVLAHAQPLPKFVYLIPNFQNPTGRTLSGDRRERIVRVCDHYGVLVVEDDPYGELRFTGSHLPSLCSYARESTVVYCGTGSKIVAPGLRVAWIATRDRGVREKLVLAKQGTDLQSGTLAQYVFLNFVSKKEAFERHLAAVTHVYGQRRAAMHEALREYMPRNVRFNDPQGGMFLWAQVPSLDTTQLLNRCAREKVVFVPGVSFYPQRDVTDSMRLNFSNSSPERIRTGVERLARSIQIMSS